ncbi:protein archease isoform X1 [Augochlora pura]
MDALKDEDFEVPPAKYEYLDHTADVQLHAWGSTLEEAFEQCGIAMFGYMTDLERVEIATKHDIEAEGHDLDSLLFHFLDELLYMFSAEQFIVAKVRAKEPKDLNARGYLPLRTTDGTSFYQNILYQCTQCYLYNSVHRIRLLTLTRKFYVCNLCTQESDSSVFVNKNNC